MAAHVTTSGGGGAWQRASSGEQVEEEEEEEEEEEGGGACGSRQNPFLRVPVRAKILSTGARFVLLMGARGKVTQPPQAFHACPALSHGHP